MYATKKHRIHVCVWEEGGGGIHVLCIITVNIEIILWFIVIPGMILITPCFTHFWVVTYLLILQQQTNSNSVRLLSLY